MEYPLIVIAGPTCTGKSDTAVRLARMIGGEVVSADSMQVYRGMDIGTAKLTRKEMCGIPHHMIDIADADSGMTVADFRERALSEIENIRSAGKVPIIAGGTGFYIDSLLFRTPSAESGTDREYREELKARAASEGPETLYSELVRSDPEYAASVHRNNSVRIIRALEFIHTTGTLYSAYAFSRNGAQRRFPFRCFVLSDNRKELYARIDSRVDRMKASGLEGEVRSLIDSGVSRDAVSMQGVGYRQIFDLISGAVSEDAAFSSIKTETRHIAKRQLTWFRHVDYSEWIDISEFGRDPSKIAEEILRRVSGGTAIYP